MIGTSCTGNSNDEFANAKAHYNPKNCPHPYHAGDLPPLIENNGYSYMSVFLNKFKVKDIIGKVIIIHDMPDDFTTQPSGNSGTKIACGEIKKAFWVGYTFKQTVTTLVKGIKKSTCKNIASAFCFLFY